MADETITESDIWADIDAMFVVPDRMPGDIDATQIGQRYGLNETNARNKMKVLVATGDWELMIVHDDSSGTGRRKVIRRVNR